MSDPVLKSDPEAEKKVRNTNPAKINDLPHQEQDTVRRDSTSSPVKHTWNSTMDGVEPVNGAYAMNFVPVRIEKKLPNGTIVYQDVRMTHEQFADYLKNKNKDAATDSTALVKTNNTTVSDTTVLKNNTPKDLVANAKEQHELCSSVGKGGENDAADCLLVKTRLLEIGAISSADAADMSCVNDGIERFQKTVVGMHMPDGRIDPKGQTWALLQSMNKTSYQAAVTAAAKTPKPATTAKHETKASAITHPIKHEPAKQGISKVLLETIADHVYIAMKGLGTDEEAVYTNLAKLNHDSAAIADFKAVYRAKYGHDVVEDIRGDFSDTWFFGKELTKALSYLNAEDKAPQIQGAATSKDLKEWAEKPIVASSIYEKNKQYAQKIVDAEKLGLVVIQGSPTKVRDTFDKIIAGDKIGTGKEFGKEANYYSDPKKQEIYILPTLAEIIKGMVKTYGDKAPEHKFSLGSFMVWNDAGKGSDNSSHSAGELRTTNHGLRGRAIDINRTGSDISFTKPEAITMVKEIFNQLPAGNYEIGLPRQGEFFPEGQKKYDPDLGGHNKTYTLLKSKELITLIESLRQTGRYMKIFADNDNHLHLGVTENTY